MEHNTTSSRDITTKPSIIYDIRPNSLLSSITQSNIRTTGLPLTCRFLMKEAEIRGWKTKVLNFEKSLFEIYPTNSERSILFRYTTSELNTSLGFVLSRDKMLSYHIANHFGVPMPASMMYTPNRAGFEEELKEFLHTHQRLVVKPNDAACGVGVTTTITDEKSLETAIEYAKQFSTKILIQAYVDGDDYRVLVLNGRTIAASLRRPACVIGDGIRTISELIEIENARPIRGLQEEKPLTKINLNEVRKYLGVDQFNNVPKNGCEVQLLGLANLSRGGTSYDVTELMHPSIFRLAEKITDAGQLSLCGADLLITGDITKPIGSGCQANVVEINASPSLLVHHCPTGGGHARNVAGAILNAIMERRAQTPSKITKSTSPTQTTMVQDTSMTITNDLISSIESENFAEIIEDPGLYLALSDGEEAYYAQQNL